METSANIVCTTGLLQFLWWQCSYATFPAPTELSEVHSAASDSVRKDVYRYRVTTNHCSPPQSWQLRAGGEGQQEHQHCSTPLLTPTINTVPETCSFCPAADNTWGQITGSPFPLLSLSKKHRALRLISGQPNSFWGAQTLLRNWADCEQGQKGSSRTLTQYLISWGFFQGDGENYQTYTPQLASNEKCFLNTPINKQFTWS